MKVFVITSLMLTALIFYGYWSAQPPTESQPQAQTAGSTANTPMIIIKGLLWTWGIEGAGITLLIIYHALKTWRQRGRSAKRNDIRMTR